MSCPRETRVAQARRHVENGRRIIAAQEALIQQTRARGGDTTLAQSLLDSFKRSQAVFEDDLRQITLDSPSASS
jgi:hypothetical protein